MTAEEFFLLSDPQDCRQELVRGNVICLPLPGGLHGVTCSRANLQIGSFIERENSGIVANAGIITGREPDNVRAPDLAYWQKDRLRPIPLGYTEIAPDLAVEILSPSNVRKQILAKLREYFSMGIRLVWVISPEDRMLTVYRTPDEGRLLRETAVVFGDEVLPGFACRVSKLLP